MDETKPDRCREYVHNAGGWSSARCGKPVKRNGMCGVHAAAVERRAKNSADRAERSNRSDEAWGRYKQTIARLERYFGPNEIGGAQGFAMQGDRFATLPPGRVTITIAALERLLREAGHPVGES